MNKVLLVGLAAILAATGNVRADDHKGSKAQNSDAPPPPAAQNSGRPQGGGAGLRYMNQLPRNGYSNLPNARPYAGNVRLEGGRMVYGSASGRLPQVDNRILPGQNRNGIPRRTWRHFEQLHGDTSVTLQNAAGRRNQDKLDNSTELNRENNGRGSRGDSNNNNTAVANNWRNRGGNRVVPFDNANTVSFSDAWQRCHDFGRDRHDRDWWHRRCNTIILIGGGFWAWDAGWWYPAWGYDPYYSNYAYNGPIYGYDGLPPDQVIANVQSALQELGYFPYEVDGVLGPATQEAIVNYQNDNGLYTSGAIDRPTLVSLGFIY